MARRAYNQNLVERPAHHPRTASRDYRRPFWLPASNYYILAAAIAFAVFFLFWGILNEGEQTPWIPAGIISSGVLIFAVVLREVIMRKARERFLLAREQLDFNLKNVGSPLHAPTTTAADGKLTLERNAVIIKEIERKSEAARVLGKLPDGHLEVFELCNEYLEKNKRELQTISANSPRLSPLRRSREKVKKLHKYHLLNWASIETRLLTREAQVRDTIDEKIENAQRAAKVLDSAMQFYPDEEQLVESAQAVNDYMVSVKVSHLVEEAEKSAFKGHFERAVDYYQDALFFLAREDERSVEGVLIAEKINAEIKKLGALKDN